MRFILGRLGCLILLILFLPLFAIFIGPLLVLAAFRGYQPLGPIKLDTVRYGPAGRIGAFLLGLAVWILVWSSLVWFAIASSVPLPTVAQNSITAPAPAGSSPAVTLTSPLDPNPTPTPTLVPSTATPRFTATLTPLPPPATPTEPPVTPTATATAPPTPTPTELFNEPAATHTPTTAPTPPVESLETLTPTIASPTLTIVDRQQAIITVEEGNVLLREAITLANDENLQRLGIMWRGKALEVAQDFATELYERYAQPLNVQFEYITRPTLSEPDAAGDIEVISRERWFYGGPTQTNQEAFEFIYTLSRQNDTWVITDYRFLNLPLPTPTTIPITTATTQP